MVSSQHLTGRKTNEIQPHDGLRNALDALLCYDGENHVPRRAILKRKKEPVDGRAIWNDSWRGSLADAVAPNDDWRGCGDADTEGPDQTPLDVSPAAIAQDKNRYERFLNFKEYLKQFPAWEKQVSFHTFKGVRHQNAVAHSSPALIAFIVGQP